MKSKTFTVVTAIVFVVMMILIYGMVRVGLPLFSIGCENLLVKWEAQNPHIDSGFMGWKTILVPGCGSMMIPENWSFLESDDFCFIIKDNGDLWAIGASKGGEGARFKSYKEFLESAYHAQISEIQSEPIVPFLMMDGSNAARLVVSENNSEMTFYCVKLFISTEQEFIWILEEDFTTDTEQYDIAEALVYSYAFGKN